MCFYWLIEHPCGHTTENIQKTVLSHCSLVDTCLRNWHQQRQYCTLEVDNPGITLPQPKTCPRVWTIDQYNGVEDEEFRTAREDGTKRVMGSFIKKQEDLLALDREARQIRDRAKREFRSQQDTIEDETEAERLEHQQQALLEDLRRVSGEEHDDDGEKNALIQIVKALPLGGQLNLEYPDIYRLQFDLLDAYQRRQHPSVNVITQKSKIGCGLQSTPECMAGHAEDGMLMCPWLMAQRLREAGKDRKELRVSLQILPHLWQRRLTKVVRFSLMTRAEAELLWASRTLC